MLKIFLLMLMFYKKRKVNAKTETIKKETSEKGGSLADLRVVFLIF